MGGLIMTKGTRRLKNHYNEEFSTWIAFYRQPDIVTIFDRGNTDISIWKDVVNYITDPNSPANGHTSDPEDPTLLPQKDPGHKHLRRRWKFFLEKSWHKQIKIFSRIRFTPLSPIKKTLCISLSTLFKIRTRL